MNPVPRASVTQAHHTHVFRRPLHPEAFPLRARRTITNGPFVLEAWLLPGGHVLRLQRPGNLATFCVSEVVTDSSATSTEGAIASFPCAGEREFEQHFAEVKVRYLTTVQTEQLNENLYRASYQDIVDLANETRALAYAFDDELGRPCLSVLDIQHYAGEIHAQSYHLIAQDGLVLRSQTIFEHP